MLHVGSQHSSSYSFIVQFILIILSISHLQLCLDFGTNKTTELYPSFYRTALAFDVVGEVKIKEFISPYKERTPGFYSSTLLLSSRRMSYLLPSEAKSFTFQIANNNLTDSLTTEIIHEIQYNKTLSREVQEVPITLEFNANEASGVPLVKYTSSYRGRNSIISNLSIFMSKPRIMSTRRKDENSTNNEFLFSNDHVYHLSDKAVNAPSIAPHPSQNKSKLLFFNQEMKYTNEVNTSVNCSRNMYFLHFNSSSVNDYHILCDSVQHSPSNAHYTELHSIKSTNQDVIDLKSSFIELNQNIQGLKQTEILRNPESNFYSDISMTEFLFPAKTEFNEPVAEETAVENTSIVPTATFRSLHVAHFEYSQKHHNELTLNATVQLLHDVSSKNKMPFSDINKIIFSVNRSNDSKANEMLSDISEAKKKIKAQEVYHYINASGSAHVKADDNIPCPIHIPVVKTHQFIVKFMILKNSFEQADLPMVFESRLRKVLNDMRCPSVKRMSFNDNIPFVFSWTNSTINNSICALNEIYQVTRMMCDSSGDILDAFSKAFLPDFKIVNVRLELLGLCFQKQTVPNIGIIAFSVACVLSVIPCFAIVLFYLLHGSSRYHSKHKLKKPRRPAIFELE